MPNLAAQFAFIFLYRKDKGIWQECKNDIVCFCPLENHTVLIRFRSSQNAFRFSYKNIFLIKEGVLLDLVPAFGPKGMPAQYYSDTEHHKLYCLEDGSIATLPFSATKELQTQKEDADRYLAYYQTLATLLEPETTPGLLSDQYEALNLSNQYSVLPSLLQKQIKRSNIPPLFFPFAFNESQIQGVQNAFSSNISIIQGPPGTGKTQTILNLIANAVIQKKTIAVVSNNNKAIMNVQEKMDKAGYGQIIALLGSIQNRENFFSELKESRIFPQRKNINFSVAKAIISNELTILMNSFRIEQKLSKIQDDIFALGPDVPTKKEETEKLLHQYFRSSSSERCETLLSLLTILEEKQKSNTGFFQRLWLWARYALRWKETKNYAALDIALKTMYPYCKYLDLKKQEEQCQEALTTRKTDAHLKEILTLSRICFENAINAMPNDSKKKPFTAENYKKQFTSFIRRYPVILSSTYSLPYCVPSHFCFDYLVIDEASQSQITSVIPCLARAKNLVVLGDDKQLAPVIDDDFLRKEKELARTHNIPQALRDNGKSFLSFLEQYIPDVPNVLLKEHYRCQKEIISFSNWEFYHSQLSVRTPKKPGVHLRAIVTVPGHHARKNDIGLSGLYNLREIDEILRILPALKGKDVGIITPYVRQKDLLLEKIGEQPNIEIGTIHTFQGKEKDVIILSLVANDAEDYLGNDREMHHAFVANPRLLNVAITRAKDLFILITSDEISKEKQGVISDLFRYLSFQEHGIVEQGKVHSIFDTLYQDLEKHRLQSVYPPSEKLFRQLLEKVLSEEKYSSLRYISHVSLRDFLSLSPQDVPAENYRYLTNPGTHVDFLIYNRFDRQPLIAFEVDGVSYHEQSPLQTLHDQWKDDAFRIAKLPLIRFRTNEDSEETKIKKALQLLSEC